MISTHRTSHRSTWPFLASVLLAVGIGGIFSACSTVPIPPTYTQAELRAICERRGGWWRGDLIASYCEYQAAMATQSP